MLMKRLGLVLLAVLSGAIVLPATGQGSTATFRSDAGRVVVTVRSLGDQLGRTFDAAGRHTDVGLASILRAHARRGDRILRLIKRLDAPDHRNRQRVRLLHHALKRAVADIRALSIAVAEHDVDAARTWTRRIIGHSPAVKRANNGLGRGVGIPDRE